MKFLTKNKPQIDLTVHIRKFDNSFSFNFKNIPDIHFRFVYFSSLIRSVASISSFSFSICFTSF